MDHPCHKCGNTVEDGKAFCSQCGAPQIRVAMAEAGAEPVTALGASLPSISGAATSGEVGLGYPVLPAHPMSAASLRTGQFCAIAAGVALLLVVLGLNPFVAATGAGFLAVALSRRHSIEGAIGAGAGAKLGALAGLFLFGASTILETVVVVVLHKGAEMRGAMMEKVQQAAARYPGPEVQPFLDFVKSPGGFTFMLAASLVFGLVAFVALGGLGGALGSALLRRRNRP